MPLISLVPFDNTGFEHSGDCKALHLQWDPEIYDYGGGVGISEPIMMTSPFSDYTMCDLLQLQCQCNWEYISSHNTVYNQITQT